MMPVPTLPTELVSDIIARAAQTPDFDFLEPDWTEGVQTGTLHSLCLVSRTFNALATPHLYSHPILPTNEAGQASLRTIESDRWQTGECAGKAQTWVKRLSLGVEVEVGKEMDGLFVVEVLRRARLDGLESVQVVGIEFKVDPFAYLQNVQHLHLKQAVYDFSPGPTCTLPRLTHLSISTLRTKANLEAPVLGSAKAPALTHLVTHNNSSVPEMRNFGRTPHPPAELITAQLGFVALAERQPWAARELAGHARLLTSLRVLVIDLPRFGQLDYPPYRILRKLPHALDTLDLAKLCYAPY